MPEFGTFRDERDGYVYKTVKIGDQVWFAENFRYDCAGSMVYDNEEECLEKYGRLYDWRTAANAAPEGWRLPSKEDWDILTNYAGGEGVVGKALKSRTGWREGWTGTDELGFGALPGGFASFSTFASFSSVYVICSWWSSSEKDGDCETLVVYEMHQFVRWYNDDKPNFNSVRYLQNRPFSFSSV